jgi:hypothetical protein
MFGGTTNLPLDQCYHQGCDNVANLNMDAFETHAKGIAAAVATYAFSWEGIPARNTTATKRSVVKSPKTVEHRHRRKERALPVKK